MSCRSPSPALTDLARLGLARERLQHLTQVAGSLSSESSEHTAARAVIVEAVERLRWRLWNGKAQDA
jgi:hypothetical protein